MTRVRGRVDRPTVLRVCVSVVVVPIQVKGREKVSYLLLIYTFEWKLNNPYETPQTLLCSALSSSDVTSVISKYMLRLVESFSRLDIY